MKMLYEIPLRLNLHGFVRNLSEHLREIEGLDPGRRKLKGPALIQPDRIFNRPVPLGDIFIIGPEGLEGAFFKGRPDPAFPRLPPWSKSPNPLQAPSRGWSRLREQDRSPRPRSGLPGPPVPTGPGGYLLYSTGFARFCSMGMMVFLILYPLEKGSLKGMAARLWIVAHGFPAP